MAKLGDVDRCEDVTDEDLASIGGTLDLSYSSIAALKAGDFEGLTGLIFLWLNENSLMSLPDNIFSGLTNLKRLYLGFNSLTSLPENVFSGLDNLNTLDLQENSLTNWPTAIADIPNLEVLNMSDNSLTSLPMNAFQNLPNLNTLDLSGNDLNNWPTAIATLPNLEELDMSSTSLTSLPMNAFQGLPELTSLSISGNSLNSSNSLQAGVFSNLPELKTLNISGNSLTNLPRGLEGLSNLENLHIGSNPFASLPARAFSDLSLSGLKELHLSLSLSLASLPDDVFEGLSKLRYLDLNYSALESLPPGVFSGLTSLQFLDLGGNPGAPFTLVMKPVAVPEEVAPNTFRVRVEEGAPHELTTTLTVDGGTVPASSVTIPLGSIESAPVVITPDEGATEAVITLGDPPSLPGIDFLARTGYAGVKIIVGGPLTLGLEELDDDVLSVTIEDASAQEGESLTFTVTLNGAVPDGLTVTPSLTGGTATQGTDYNSTPTPASLTFVGTEGEAQTFAVATIEDDLHEGAETFTVDLSVSTDGVDASATATGTIIDDDALAVTIEDAGAEEGESLTFRVTLNGATIEAVPGGLTVTPSLTGVTAAGGVDYNSTPTPASLTFAGTAPAGETKTFTVATIQDEIAEGAETFTVDLSVSGTAEAVDASATATGTIRDDEALSVTIEDASAQEGGSLTFSVHLNGAVSGGLTVTPSLTDVTAAGGVDYNSTPTPASLTFAGTAPAGETETFTVATIQDEIAEGVETFTVDLSVSGTAEAVDASATATGTIRDDEALSVTIEDASAQEGGSLTFSVHLNGAVSGGLTVTPSLTDVTAAGGVDYNSTPTPASLTFAGTAPAGETETFTVATIQDEIAEGVETFTVDLSVSGTAEAVDASATATGTIRDDEALSVTIEDASAQEGGSLTFSVHLNGAVSGGLTVTPSLTGVTAEQGTDYNATPTPASLTFVGTEGEAQTFEVATIQDAIAEGAETFTVTLAVSKDVVDASATATGTIIDDDALAVTIADASAEEGGSLTFRVVLNGAVSGGLTVTPSLMDGTAEQGSDYNSTPTPASLTFAGIAGEAQTFRVATIQDAIAEGAETFTVDLAVSTDGVDASATATGTIRDDDALAVTIADAEVEEGGSLTFTVTLNGAVSGGLTVTPSFVDGTAEQGSDYNSTPTPASLTFAGIAGEAQTFRVATIQDEIVEGAETFTVTLVVSGTTAVVDASATATGTIIDDDAPSVTITDASAEEGGSLTFRVTLNGAVPGGLTVTPSFMDQSATQGLDYTPNPAALAFTGISGEAHTLTVATIQDAIVEGDETFTVDLVVSGTTEDVDASDAATGTIIDDDAPSVTIADAWAEEGGSLTFTVTLDGAVSGGLTVTPSFMDQSATQGSDYNSTPTPASLPFAGTAGEAQTFRVATIQDAIAEGAETFTVDLSVSKDVVDASDAATGTIIDDDALSVTIADASAEEGGSLTFRVTLNGAVSGGLTVTPSFMDGTATQGSDYNSTPDPASLTFAGAAGEAHTLTVATIQDAIVEGAETFTVNLVVSGTTEDVDASDAATGTIIDDDALSVTIDDASAEEGGSLTFRVTLNGTVPGGLTVTPSFTDGTATQGTDYAPNTTALPFAGIAGEAHTLTVATIQDAIPEGDETFIVTLAVSGTTEAVDASDAATGTIIDDDALSVTITDAEAEEGGSLTFRVTLNGVVSGGLIVTPSFTDQSATQGTDYTPNPAALTFVGTAGEERTLTVATIQDAIAEDAETFTVDLAVSGTTEAVDASDAATGTIIDDDALAVTIDDASAEEGGSLRFTVTLNGAVSGGLTVTPSFTDQSATQGTDYTPNPAALTFVGTAGEERTLTVATIQDAIAEGDETFTVDLAVSGTTEAVDASDAATGTIIDDDAAAVTIADASAEEGGSLTFTATLNGTVPGGLTVTPSFTDGTATQGIDYAPNTTALTFTGTAGEEHTFTVATIQDDIAEGDETFTVDLAVSGTTEAVDASDTATGTIIDDDDDDVAPGLLTLAVDPRTVAEGDDATDIRVTATLDNPAPSDMTVTVRVSGEEATVGSDFAAVEPFRVEILGNTSSGFNVFSLAVLDDEVFEGAERLRIVGTAGALSSLPVYVTIRDNDGGVVVCPNPFTPNDDRINDRIKFSIDELNLAGTPTLEIYSLEGAPVHTSVSVLSAPFGCGEHGKTRSALSWDGKDDDGRPQPAGIYLFAIRGGGGSSVVASGHVALVR